MILEPDRDATLNNHFTEAENHAPLRRVIEALGRKVDLNYSVTRTRIVSISGRRVEGHGSHVRRDDLPHGIYVRKNEGCLLYTSDAADE